MLLGNMWSQNWEYLQDILIENTVDLDKAIRDNKWTVLDMVNCNKTDIIVILI